MKKLISIVCCTVFIGVASMSFAADEQSSAERTKVAIQIIQLDSQLQLLKNIIANLTTSTKAIEDKILNLQESLKQSETKIIEEEEAK